MSEQIEGRRPVLEALRSGRPLTEVLVARGTKETGALAAIVREAAERGVPLREATQRGIEERARSRSPQGVIAVVPAFAYASVAGILADVGRAGEAALLVALDGVTDPQNVGAVARSTEAAGGHGLLVPRRRSAPVTPAVEKAAAGALAHLPVARVENLPRALERLKEENVWVVALGGEGETSIYELPVATEPVCLVVGAEGRGVSRLVGERADVRARIPLRGRVGSLNASVAAGVALFEVLRRRGYTS